MPSKFLIAAILVSAMFNPTQSIAKAGAVVFHSRPYTPCERQECMRFNKTWSSVAFRDLRRWSRECGSLIGHCDDSNVIRALTFQAK